MMQKENAGSAAMNLAMRLGAAIIRGEYAAGAQVPTEHELCREYDCSRGVAREAFKMLAAKGLVASRRRSGTVVRPVAAWNLLDPDILRWMQQVEYSHRLLYELIQVRLAVEPEACAIISKRRREVDFTTLEEAVVRMEDPRIPEAGLLDADLDFHLGLLDATGNRFYRQFQPLLRTTLRFAYELIDLYKLFEPERTISAREHREVLDHMRAGRHAQARRTDRTMIEKVSGALEGFIAEDQRAGQ